MAKKEYQINEGRQLTGDARYSVSIPSHWVLHYRNEPLKLLIMIYLFFKRDITHQVRTSLFILLTECGYRLNNSKGNICHRFQDCLLELVDEGVISIEDITVLSKPKTFFLIRINDDIIPSQDNKIHFFTIYYDELKTILFAKQNLVKYSAQNSRTVLLLLYCYLKICIYNRTNTFKSGEENMTVEDRRKEKPAAYNDFFNNMAAVFDLSVRIVANYYRALQELGLIHIYEPKKKKIIEAAGIKYRNNPNIFTFTYKREGNIEYENGYAYYQREARNKFKKYSQQAFPYNIKGDSEYESYELEEIYD